MTSFNTVVVSPTSPQRVVVVSTPPMNISVGTPVSVSTVTSSTEHVDVQQLGIIGPPGPQGPQGIAGGAPLSFPVVAISSWYQTHAFGYPPEVRLVDDAGEEVEIGVEYPAVDVVAISFPLPFTGTIYLS